MTLRAVHVLLAGLAAAAALAGCGQRQRCQSELNRAQEVVKNVDSKSTQSLDGAVSALDSAIAVCDEAGMGAERGKLVEAKREIAAHRDHLAKKAAQKRRGPPTPEERAKLEQEGDATCPKGQGYKLAGGSKEIRCTGPQLIDMSMAEVEEYFATRRFKVTKTSDPPRLRAEFGAELHVFTFDKPSDTSGARCVEVFPAPGVRWQEAVSRTTGMRLDRIKPGGSVKAKRGELPIAAEDSDKKQVARIGSCG